MPDMKKAQAGTVLRLRIAYAAVVISAVFYTTVASAQNEKLPAWAEPIPTTDNAAMYYWQAIALIPKWNGAQQPLIDHPEKFLLDSDAAQEVFSGSQKAMTAMHKAAGHLRCDWGIDWNVGPATPLHARPLRDLEELARFRVAFQAQRGELDGAIDDGVAICRLSRHMSRSAGFYDWMASSVEDAAATAVLAELIPRLSAEQLRDLARRLAALPKTASIREAVLFEKRICAGWLLHTIAAGRTSEVRDKLRAIVRGNKEDLAQMEAELDRPATFLAGVKRMAADFDECVELVDTSFDEFPNRWNALETKIKGDTASLSRFVLSPIPLISNAGYRMRVRQAILQAAIGYRLEGDVGLESYPDPTVGKPFPLKKTESGFELQSHLRIYGANPLVVHFGPPAK